MVLNCSCRVSNSLIWMPLVSNNSTASRNKRTWQLGRAIQPQPLKALKNHVKWQELWEPDIAQAAAAPGSTLLISNTPPPPVVGQRASKRRPRGTERPTTTASPAGLQPPAGHKLQGLLAPPPEPRSLPCEAAPGWSGRGSAPATAPPHTTPPHRTPCGAFHAPIAAWRGCEGCKHRCFEGDSCVRKPMTS